MSELRPFVSKAYNPSYWKEFTDEAERCLGCGWLYRKPNNEVQCQRMYCRACESKRENQ